MMLGVSAETFAQRFGTAIEEVYGDVLQRQQALGLLKKSGDRIYLTPRGIDVSNTVMAEFL
jgi:oxygen-independent coproporphyrinogen-3 oxidase